MHNFIHIHCEKCLPKSTQKYALKVGVPSDDSNQDFLMNLFENMCKASSHIKLSNVWKMTAFGGGKMQTMEDMLESCLCPCEKPLQKITSCRRERIKVMCKNLHQHSDVQADLDLVLH